MLCVCVCGERHRFYVVPLLLFHRCFHRLPFTFLLHHIFLATKPAFFSFTLSSLSFTTHTQHNLVLVSFVINSIHFRVEVREWESSKMLAVATTVAEIQVFLIIYLSINQFGCILYICHSNGFGKYDDEKACGEQATDSMSLLAMEHEDDDIGIDSCSTLE